ncbi:MAG: DMT family transporter, partial [Chloroflexi bacterium]|nr:DMT family transporter [Chloroflexota bacterium]
MLAHQRNVAPAIVVASKTFVKRNCPTHNDNPSLVKKTQPPFPPLFGILLGILAVSAASIFIRYAQVEAPSLVIAAYRMTLASLVLTPVALVRHRAELRSLSRSETRLALLSGLLLGVHFAAWITSLAYTTVASSVVLVSTAPFLVALLSPALLHERLSRALAASLGLTLVGVALIGLDDACALSLAGLRCPPLADFLRGRAFLGDLLAFLGALAATGYFMIGRRLRARLSLVPYITLVYGVAAVLLAAAMLIAGLRPTGYAPLTYLWFVLLALVPQLLGHSSFNWALRYLPATFVALATLGEPIGSTLLAYLLLHEVPTPARLLGGGLILV